MFTDNKITKLKDSLPVLYAVVIIWGNCYYEGRYSVYNLPYYQYISLTEILINFKFLIDSLGTNIVFILLLLIVERIIANYSSENKFSTIETSLSFPDKINRTLFILSILVLVPFVAGNFLDRESHFFEQLVNSFYFYILPDLIIISLFFLGGDLLIKYSQLILLVIILLGSSYFYICGGKFGKLAMIGKIWHVSFVYKTSRIETNDTLILVGTSEQAIFLYSKRTRSTCIYDKKSVDSLTYYNR